MIQMIPRFFEASGQMRAEDKNFRSAPLHWHTYYEIELTVTGHVRHIINGQVYMTSPGFVSIMTPCDFHEYVESGCESNIRRLFFMENYISSEIRQLLLSSALPRCAKLNPEVFSRIFGLFDELIDSPFDDSPIGSLQVKNLTERLCLAVMSACEKYGERAANGSSEYGGTELLNTVLTYIESHFTGKITLNEAAAVAHLSPNYFSHFFSRSLGTTFSQYVKLKRIQYASVLLLTTAYTIDDIAYQAGFSSTSFFNNVFKKQYHLAPFAYRSRFRA